MAFQPVVNVKDITLDGAAVPVGQDGRDLAVRIEAGAYATPFWIAIINGVSIKVTALPWSGVLPAP